MSLVNAPGVLTNPAAIAWVLYAGSIKSVLTTAVLPLGDGNMFLMGGADALAVTPGAPGSWDNKSWRVSEDTATFTSTAAPAFVPPVTVDEDPNGVPGVLVRYTNEFTQYSLARLTNGQIAVWGATYQRPNGDYGLDPLQQLRIYDPATNTWAGVQVPMIEKQPGLPICSFTGALQRQPSVQPAVKNNRVLVPECVTEAGTFPTGTYPNTSACYATIDFPSGVWQRHPYPAAVADMSWTRLSDGRVFMCGGRDAATGTTTVKNAWIIDFDGSVTVLPNLPTSGRYKHYVMQLMSGDVLVYGGSATPPGAVPLLTVYKYNFTYNSWTRMADFPLVGGTFNLCTYTDPVVLRTASGEAMSFGAKIFRYNEGADAFLAAGPDYAGVNPSTALLIRSIYGRLHSLDGIASGDPADGVQALDTISYNIPHYISVGGAPFTPAEAWVNFTAATNLAAARVWVLRTPFSVGINIEGLDDGGGGYFVVPVDVFISANHPEES